mgnify:CR=1 FL=1
MTDIKSMTLEELTAWLKEQGEPAFRAKQIFTGCTGASPPLTR